MHKYISAVLVVLLMVAAGALAYQRWDFSNQRRDLNNKLAKVQKMQKETETAYSRLAIETEDLRTSKKDLQKVIDDRDESILALSQANLKLKDKIVRVENAKQTIVDRGGNTVEPDSGEVTGCESDLRVRVDFEQEDDPLKVSGHTLTNPPEAEIKIEWLRALNLELVLTKNDDGTFRVYLDSETSDFIPADLKLQVDPSVLDYRWYQNISLGSNVLFGETGLLFGISANYNIFSNFMLGPMFTVGYVGEKAETFYGVNVVWHPWR